MQTVVLSIVLIVILTSLVAWLISMGICRQQMVWELDVLADFGGDMGDLYAREHYDFIVGAMARYGIVSEEIGYDDLRDLSVHALRSLRRVLLRYWLNLQKMRGFCAITETRLREAAKYQATLRQVYDQFRMDLQQAKLI